LKERLRDAYFAGASRESLFEDWYSETYPKADQQESIIDSLTSEERKREMYGEEAERSEESPKGILAMYDDPDWVAEQKHLTTYGKGKEAEA
jgi:hypothetical protein